MPHYSVYEKLRDARHITDSDVLKATGLRRNLISDWKRGSMPKYEKIAKLAAFFGVPASLFYQAPEIMPGQDAANA